jgi:F-type H+-transporting ATPase subunit delta
MIEGRLSRRYSRALFQLARDAGQEDTVGQELEQFFAVYNGSDLQKVLINPAFSIAARKKILVEVIATQQLSGLVTKFLSLLLERDRLGELAGIVSCYRRLLNEAKGRVEARVVSVNGLDPGLIEQLSERLRVISGKEVLLQHETDPELLGGLLIELEGKIYDGTISTQLEMMKQRIARGQ